MHRHCTDSGTSLIQSPMGQNNLAVFTSDRINEGFSQENVWPFSRVAKKSGRNNEATVFNTEVAVRRVTRCSQCSWSIHFKSPPKIFTLQDASTVSFYTAITESKLYPFRV